MYKISVFNEQGEFTPWFENLMKTYYNEVADVDDSWIDRALLPYNGRNIYRTEFVMFNTEQDFLMFLLKHE